MVDKITESGKTAYLEGNHKAQSHLYLRKTKEGYKVDTARSPLLMKILHIFKRISTEYFYGEDAVKKIRELKLIADPKIPVVEVLPPPEPEIEVEVPPNVVVDTPPEPVAVEEPSFIEGVKNWVTGLFSTEEKEELYLNPEFRALNVQDVIEEGKVLAAKFEKIPNPHSFKVRGQENFGNICYMNSALQGLETIYGIHDDRCEALIREDLSLQEGESLKDLEKRLLKIWMPLKDEEDILFKWTYLLLLQAKLKGTDADIEQALRLHHKLFFVSIPHKGFRQDIFGQKDSAEYLEHFLDILGPKGMTVSDVLKAEINGKKVEERPTTDPSGNLIHVVIDKKEHQTLVSRILEGCEEKINEAKDFAQGIAVGYTKSTRYKNPPATLHLHIVRFENDKARSWKNDTKLIMNDIHNPIDLSPIFDKEAKYQLTSFNVHSGSLNGGHYVAYVLREGKWHYISDTTTREVTLSEVPFGDAYILNFKKI